jgi:hypothetical protein
MAHEGELEQTEDERCRHLANFVAFTWVELNDQAKKGGATAFEENYLPTPNDPKYESAWNASAWYFGLTGQDFSALVCEALTRLQGRGDEVVTI